MQQSDVDFVLFLVFMIKRVAFSETHQAAQEIKEKVGGAGVRDSTARLEKRGENRGAGVIDSTAGLGKRGENRGQESET